MAKSFEGWLTDSELDHLRTLIRLAFEFSAYLKAGSQDQDAAQYRAESILAGVDSFYQISFGYRFLGEALRSEITWDISSFDELRKRFTRYFDELASERNPSKQCRRVLDLFKLQVIFAAIVYD